jgi:type IV fimbrial biogenesis protein FimT
MQGSGRVFTIGSMNTSRIPLSRTGFSLVELMITLAVAALVVGLAIPNMRSFLQNNRLTSAANDLLHSFQTARAEAIKRQQGPVVVCATADPDAADAAMSCNFGAFRAWFVFADTNGNWQHDGAEPIVERHALVDATVTVRTGGEGIRSYDVTGFANAIPVRVQSRNVVFCDLRGNQAIGNDSTARVVNIAQTGRAWVTKRVAEVTTALTAIGAACP